MPSCPAIFLPLFVFTIFGNVISMLRGNRNSVKRCKKFSKAKLSLNQQPSSAVKKCFVSIYTNMHIWRRLPDESVSHMAHRASPLLVQLNFWRYSNPVWEGTNSYVGPMRLLLRLIRVIFFFFWFLASQGDVPMSPTWMEPDANASGNQRWD